MKLPFALPDETLFSRIVRGLTLSGLSNQLYLSALLDNYRASVHPYLTSSLSSIANVTGESVQEMYWQQTLFPVFSFYLPQYSQRIYDSALSSFSAFRSCQLVSFGEHEELTLKYCSLCAEENIKSYGVSYWNKKHQLPGIETCYSHKVWLHHVTLPKRPHIRDGLLPPPNVPLRACNEHAYFFTKHVMKILETTIVDRASFLGYQSLLDEKGYITAKGRTKRKILAYDLMQQVKLLDYPSSSLLPKHERDYKYLSPLLTKLPSQHPFKHMLLGFCLENADSKSGRALPISNDLLQKQSERSCQKLLMQGLSMAEISRQTGKSRCYLKALALREEIPIQLRPRIITQEVKSSIIHFAKKGFHRAAIARSLNISSGSVELMISSSPGLVDYRKKCKFESTRRRYKTEITRYLKAQPKAIRQQVKNDCSAAFFWLYHHQKEWLNRILPIVTPPIQHPRVNWKRRDIELSSQVIPLIARLGKNFSLTKLDEQLGGHGWLTKYAKKFPLTLAVINSFLKGNSKSVKTHHSFT